MTAPRTTIDDAEDDALEASIPPLGDDGTGADDDHDDSELALPPGGADRDDAAASEAAPVDLEALLADDAASEDLRDDRVLPEELLGNDNLELRDIPPGSSEFSDDIDEDLLDLSADPHGEDGETAWDGGDLLGPDADAPESDDDDAPPGDLRLDDLDRIVEDPASDDDGGWPDKT